MMEDFFCGVDDIENLKSRVEVIERNYDVRVILIQLGIGCGWTDVQIKNVIGATNDELKFFRS